MGKQITIKGADFSDNAVVLNINALAEQDFYPLWALANPWGNKTESDTRCCVLMADLSDYIGHYSKIKVTLKTGYDYVAAVGSTTGGVYYKGNEQVVTFAWVTDYEYVVMPLSEATPYLSLNLRHDDNTTEFAATTSLLDIVDEIILY